MWWFLAEIQMYFIIFKSFFKQRYTCTFNIICRILTLICSWKFYYTEKSSCLVAQFANLFHCILYKYWLMMRCISKSMDPMFVIFTDAEGGGGYHIQRVHRFGYTLNYKSVFVLLSDKQVKWSIWSFFLCYRQKQIQFPAI